MRQPILPSATVHHASGQSSFRGVLAGAILGLSLALLPMLPPLSAQPAFAQSEESGDAQDPDTFEMLELFGEIFQIIREDYVEEQSDEELIEAAIRGMLSSLDPHSTYMNREAFQAMQTQTSGEFGGLGIEVNMDESGYVRVVSPIDDTPADRAGIEAGDLISALDGDAVQGLTLDEAVKMMRGKVGEDIVLTILRDGVPEPFDITVTRDIIQIQSVRSRVEGGNVGYIRITTFSGQTQTGLERAIDRIEEEAGEALLGYVLDLRNNPGGLLSQGVSVSDTFLERGEIVSTRGRSVEDIQRFQATPGDLTDGAPIVVLINGGSASASEIVAGALQDQERAILVGTRTFGKGSVQTISPLSRTRTAIKLTTQRFYTPSGTSIQQLGITPDILIERARIEVIDTGPRRREQDLTGSLENEDEDVNTPDSQVETAVEDYQLARALDLVRGIGLYRSQTVNE